MVETEISLSQRGYAINLTVGLDVARFHDPKIHGDPWVKISRLTRILEWRRIPTLTACYL